MMRGPELYGSLGLRDPSQRKVAEFQKWLLQACKAKIHKAWGTCASEMTRTSIAEGADYFYGNLSSAMLSFSKKLRCHFFDTQGA